MAQKTLIEEPDEFTKGGPTISSPVYIHEESFNDKYKIILAKTDGRYAMIMSNHHADRGWRYIESVITSKKETLAIRDRSSDVSCSGECRYAETGVFFLPPGTLKGGKEFRFKVIFKNHSQILEVPSGFIEGFLQVAEASQ